MVWPEGETDQGYTGCIALFILSRTSHDFGKQEPFPASWIDGISSSPLKSTE